jgi:hypothetical protein
MTLSRISVFRQASPSAHENTLDVVTASVELIDDLASLQRDRLSGGVVTEGEIADRLVELHADQHSAHLVVSERASVACESSVQSARGPKVKIVGGKTHRADPGKGTCPASSSS